ncbi:hypothetical protein AB0N07_25570 [Streptomyces sp. NPDC051172]|uniref:hypothetical protein n=1 Tax=Streptomyces sp. NPDC051172 TaxID=3155796 RepID=UPI003435DD20
MLGPLYHLPGPADRWSRPPSLFDKHPKNLRKATIRVGDTEPGDSGGPALSKGNQVGVLFGPNEYSSVASHRARIPGQVVADT